MPERKITQITHEQLQEEKTRFYAAHQNENFWAPVTHSPEQLKRLQKYLGFLMATQNGTDIDDFVMGDTSRLAANFKDRAEGKSVLVIGAGTGREMKAFRELGAARVEGVTFGGRNKKFAEEIVGEHPIICDAHFCPWTTESFDIITAFHVFEHSYAPPVFLLEMNRLLRVGGTLALETPDAKTTSMDSWLHHVLCPTPRQLFALLLKTGFKPAKASLGSLDYDMSGYKSERDLPDEWADKADVFVYMEGVKMDPQTYERGDMARFYAAIR